MSEHVCPHCGGPLEVQIGPPSEPKPRRRWLRAALLMAGLAATGICVWALVR